MRPIAKALPAALLFSACHRTPPVDAHEEAATASAKPAASAAPQTTGSADASLPPFLPDGCFRDVEMDAGARPLLDSLVQRCVQGMQPVVDKPLVAELEQGREARLSFSLDNAEKCVRAVAAGGPGVEELELSLSDEQGHTFSRGELHAPFALLDRDGPVCLPKPGKYRVLVRLRRGSGWVAVQVFRAK